MSILIHPIPRRIRVTGFFGSVTLASTVALLGALGLGWSVGTVTIGAMALVVSIPATVLYGVAALFPERWLSTTPAPPGFPGKMRKLLLRDALFSFASAVLSTLVCVRAVLGA